MGEYENPMLRQVLSVPELLEQVYPDVEPQVRYVLTTPQIYSIKKVVLTSCGDGYAACMAAKRAFEQFLQIPIEVVDPLSLARYYQMKWVGESPCDPLVIAVSNSGQVTRVVEAVRRMRAHNALTVAITSNPDSPLGQAAENGVDGALVDFRIIGDVLNDLIPVHILAGDQRQNTHLDYSLPELCVHVIPPLLY